MVRTCIIVADGARARFMTLEIPIEPSIDGGARLVEHDDLVNPEAEAPERGLFSDRMGRGHASGSGAAHAVDDHREQHQQEVERRFVRRLLERAERFVGEQGARRLVLVSEARLLGALRTQLVDHRLRGVEVLELAENLTRRALGEIQAKLAARGALPAARAPDLGVFRPRGQAPATR
ncbi:MAG TPA: host attachment protein [Polyangiaceae bacterium]|jgi:protein required for attachment to host cells|nr:host attachment protein [Polyangiaceae bacterium]